MMKKYLLSVITLLTATVFAQPVITSFSPIKGEVGDLITISGTGFSSTASSNAVFFGSVKATVSSATTTQLVASVPKGTIIAPISVLVAGKLCESRTTFHVTNSALASNAINTSGNWSSNVSFTSGSQGSMADMIIAAADFDGNGMVDVAKIGSGAIHVHRNLMSQGATITTGSFGAASTLTTSGTALSIITKDINSDGLLDIISSSASGIDIFRNTSSVGSISFAAKISIASSSSEEVRSADFDRDGLLDIIGFSGSTVNVYRNATSFTNLQLISFSTAQSFSVTGNISGIDVGDMNLDGKIDIITQQATTLQILLNSHSTGTNFSFANTPSLSGMAGQNTKVGDLDDDGDLDIYSSSWKIARNDGASTISVSSISSLTVLSMTLFENSMGISFADFNGNGRIDIVGGTDWDKSWININSALPLTVSSFSSWYRPESSYGVSKGAAIGVDLNGDDKVDYLASSGSYSQFSVAQNNMTPIGLSISGTLSAFTKCANMASGIQQFSVTGVSLTTSVIVTPPSGFEVSTSSTFANNIGTNSQPLTFGAAGNVTQTIYVRMIASSNGTFSGNIECTSGTYPMKTVPCTGSTIEYPSISGSTYVLTIPGTVSLSGTGTPAASNVWTSSNSNFATISSSGLVTAIAPGSLTITYTTNQGCQATKGIAILAPAPIISSFSPSNGAKIGASIVINGTNFSATMNNNTVWFGGVKAVVTAASTTQLTVTVPKTTAISELTVVVSNAVSNKKYFPLKNSDAGTLSLTWNSTYFQSPNYKSLSNTSPIWNFEMADMNNDGLLDWIIPGTGKVTIMLNPGSNTSFSLANVTQTTIATTASENSTALKLVDLNNDGYIDLLIGMGGKQVQVIKNNGNNTYTSQGTASFSALYNDNINSIAFSDVNNDGYLDLMATVYGTYTATKFQILTQDPANPFTFSNYFNNCQVGTNIAFVKSGLIEDLNGDGLEDAFFLQYNGGAKRSNGTSTSFATSPTDLGSDTDMEGYTDGYFVDFENDGDLDLIYPGESNYRIFKNNGSGALSLSSVGQHSRFGHLFDIDNDGDKDIVGSTFFGISGALNSSNSSFANSTSFLGSPSGNEYLGNSKLVDLNGDGYLDITYLIFDYNTFVGTKIATSIFQGNTDPSISISGTLSAFQKCTNIASSYQSVTYNCLNLQSGLSVTPPVGFEVSTSSTFTTVGTNSSPLSIGTSGNFSGTLYIRMIANANNANYNAANIQFTALNSPTQTISCQGNTISTTPVVTTTSGYTCGTGTVALSATATNSPTAYAFYSASSNGSLLSSTNTYTTPSISATTTYWVQATNVCGITNPRVAVTASVYTAPAITAESLTTQTICQNFSSTALSVTATGQGLSYQWYSNSSPSNSGGATISGAIASSYSPSTSALGTNYYYVVVSGTCGPVATSNVSGAFSVNGPLAGTIAVPTGASVCTGSTKQLVLSGHSGSIQWQESSSLGGTYTDISGATSPTYTTTALNSNTYYRAKLSSGSCTPVYTAAQLISVDPLSVAGTISGSSGVCSGSTSTLTLSGHTGTIVWTNATQLNGTYNSVGVATPSYTTSAITTTQYYKAQVTSGTCPAVTTSAYTVSTTPLGNIGNISGSSTVTLGGTATYSVSAVTNATSYLWNLPSGTSLASNGPNGSSVTINIANNFAGGTISVQAQGCTNSVLKTRILYPISIAPTLSIVSSTPGAPLFCGNTTASLSTTTTSPTQSALYEWTLPTGVSFANGTTFEDAVIEVAFSSSFNPGSISVKRISATETLVAYYNVSSLAAPATLTGPSSLCGLTTATYQALAVTGANSYEWSLPNGMTGSSTSTTINTSFVSGVSGTVKVRAIQDGCGVSPWKSLSVGSLATLGSISGPTNVCGASANIITTSGTVSTIQSNTATYSIAAVTGATGYTWSVNNSNMTISSGQGTNEITVSYDLSQFTSGTISVLATGSSGCTSGTRTLNVTKTSATISGPTIVCDLTTATYSINAPSGSTVTWALPSWMTPATNYTINSNPILVNIAEGPSSQTLSATYTTACGAMSASRSVGCGLFTQLSSTSCGATLPSVGWGISANTVIDATSYQFHITDPNGATYSVVSPDRWITLSEATGMPLFYGEDYAIKVRVQLDGTYGAYGASCTISTPALPITTLSSASCGTTLPSIGWGISANNVAAATAYRFNITIPSQGATVYTVESPDRWFTLSEAMNGATSMPLLYGVSYSVKVQVESGTGNWGAEGAACTVTTPTLPTTTLSTASCGATLPSIGWGISATNIAAATAYRFNITIPAQGATVYNIVSPDRWITLSEVTNMPLLYGTTYSITVQVESGTGNWGAASTACTVTTPTLPTTTLSTASCGATLPSIGWGISATNVAAATAYRFNITVPGNATPFVVESVDRWITLSEAANMPLLYATIYSITVQAESGAGNWSAPSTSCTVNTPSLPTTTLSTASCGTTLPSLGWGISANNIAAATMYEFEITGPDNTVHTVQSVDRWITLSEASSMSLYNGSAYSIRVKVENGIGTWGAFGASCTVTTPGTTLTNLTTASCGATVTSTTTINIISVAGAENYNVQFIGSTNPSQVYDFTTVSTSFTINDVNAYLATIPNSTLVLEEDLYTVKVQYTVDNDAWSSYGPICTLNYGSNGLMAQDPELYEEANEGIVNQEEESLISQVKNTWSATTTSNPFELSFKVNLNGAEAIESNALFTATLTDMSGKVYTTQTLSKEALTEEYFGQDLAPGMYMLTLRQGEELRVLRVVKR